MSGAVTKEGMQDVRPGREAVSEVQGSGGKRPRSRGLGRGDGEQPVVGDATFRSYYGKPIINKPVWEAPDIAGYLFLGGLAGASSVMAAGAAATGRPALARGLKVTSTAAVALSGVALVHDLGRPARFFNMLRVFKPTSPMSVGSWLLAGYAPFSAGASFSAVTGLLPAIGAVGTAGAALIGPVVATYTAALVSDTAVPAWHDGHREMPFVFAASALSAAAGMGMLAAPMPEAGPARMLGVVAGAAELGLLDVMKRSMGLAKEAFTASEKAHRYERAAQIATGIGIAAGAVLGKRSRIASAVAGAGLLVGSALSRFAIFEAGLESAEDPRYTVVPQRRRLESRVSSEIS
ncbi:MAG TPA: NrfD/PsrC family molybdoenzyme membrane anchor subunit [Acidimicrobiales bacterium]|nr:NrfD/PsrC family molybdoenzyme membrane anchor subunit [Acidimicrobiales bacterium]